MIDITTTPQEFVRISKRAMRIVAEEALAELPTTNVLIQTPCDPSYPGIQLPDPSSVCAVSIMRSGDALLEAVRELEPAIKVGKILIQRDESKNDKPAVLYYSKLPPNVTSLHVLICDPMIATGGSAVKAIQVLVNDHQVDPTNIVFASMICAPEGLQILAQTYPMVKIVTAFVDDHLNEDKYIVPGLGDYGDRFFHT